MLSARNFGKDSISACLSKEGDLILCQLSEPAEVTLSTYAVDGTLIRTVALGHQPAGMYQSKSRAAYWDGRNEVGESVASGVYFYTLSAGAFSATRKMLIRK